MACVHAQTEKRKDKKLGSYKQLLTNPCIYSNGDEIFFSDDIILFFRLEVTDLCFY